MRLTVKTLLTLLAVVIGATFLWKFAVSGPTDREMIQQALADSLKASKEGRPGGVLDFLSDSFRVNDVHYSPTADVAKVIRQYKPDITVTNNEPAIRGQTATIQTDVRLSAPLIGRVMEIPSVTFSFKKVGGTRWLVIPSQDWKLDQVTVPPEVVQQISSQFQ